MKIMLLPYDCDSPLLGTVLILHHGQNLVSFSVIILNLLNENEKDLFL